MRRIPLILALAASLMVAATVPAAATPPSAVQFEVESSLVGAPSLFVASGAAVDDGLMCASGETTDLYAHVSGFKSPKGVNLQVIKQFTCDDGSGDFLVKLQVRIDKKGVNFNWNTHGGTGAYVDLHGSGSGVGLPDCGNDCVLDIYEGGLHID